MERSWTSEDARKVRLWCIAAVEQPVVAVFARCFSEERWTCVLRWYWKSGKVEEGAWTKLDVVASHCRLSKNGEFLLYHARGPVGGPFCTVDGGARTISRLPWLAALTDIQPWGLAGDSPSKHGLKPMSQEKLWQMFESDLSPHLLEPFMEWETVDVSNGALPGVAPRHAFVWALATNIPSSDVSLIVVADSANPNETWSVWRDDLRFFVTADRGERRVLELQGVRWATPMKDRQLLVATADAELGVIQFKRHDELLAMPTLEKSASLANLTPNPGPAPSWAIAEVWK